MKQIPQFYKDYFQSLEELGIKLDDGQKRWYMKKHETQQDDMKKEYPSTIDEAFESKADGYYYASYVSAARTQKRIINLIPDPNLRVHTAWDLGFTDATSIIFFQISGREIHIIEYLEGTGKPLTEYVKIVKKKDYTYGTHIAPHDIRNYEYTTGKTRFEVAAALGITFSMAPNVAIQDGIDMVQNTFTRFFFNNCDDTLLLVKRIENYSKKWDTKLEMWSGVPLHNESSHAADALRYLALGLDNCIHDAQGISQSEADNLYRNYGRKI